MTSEVRRAVTLGRGGGTRARLPAGLATFSFLSFVLVTQVCSMCEKVLSIYLQYVRIYVHTLYFDSKLKITITQEKHMNRVRLAVN